MTVTLEVLNNKAINLLADMELLDLIRLDSFPRKATLSNEKLSSQFAGALDITDAKFEYFQKSMQENRNEWNRNIF